MRTLPVAVLALLLQSAFPNAAASQMEKTLGAPITELSPAVKRCIKASCFEVVLLKPEKDSLTYEKELPWEQLPFAARNDKYISVGTAFAVSATDLLTAFHVLDLNQESLSYPRYFIRDAEQRVYEIDRILQSHEHRDAVRFTVKDRAFDQWLKLEPRFELNRSVFTVGNALGEGVVVRRGDLVGTLPEPLDGAFSLLKSSADVNDGNSGGPLLDSRGRVIGLVVQRKDNLSYSLPVSEISSLPAGKASFNARIIYGFSLFPEKSKLVSSVFEIPLPLGYRELKRQAQQIRQSAYRENMEALFAGQKELFPAGASSADAINQIPTSTFLEVIYKDENSNRWALAAAEIKKFDLDDNGLLRVAKSADFLLIGIRKPSSLSYEDLIGKPKAAMDLIFKGLNIPREIGAEKVRITSLGEPLRSLDHRDRWGRPWRIAVWHMEYSDQVIFLCYTPVPTGLLGLLQQSPSSALENWTIDLKKIVDNLSVPYTGRIREWLPFLSQPRERLPGAFQSVRVACEPGKTLQLRTPWVRLDLDKRSASLTPDDFLDLYMGFERVDGQVAWGLRRLVYSEDGSENYLVWNKHLKPEAGMNEQSVKNWQEVARDRHPYAEDIMLNEGRTDIAKVLKSFLAKGVPPQDAPSLITLYVARTGTVAKGAMRKLLNIIAGGFQSAAAE